MQPTDALSCAVLALLGLAIAWIKRRDPSGPDGYFLAGRSLGPWQIGASMVMGALTPATSLPILWEDAMIPNYLAAMFWSPAALLIVAFGFFPFFLRAGIATLPQFLGIRFGPWARAAMALALLVSQILLLAVMWDLLAPLVHGLREWIGEGSSIHWPVAAALVGLPLVFIVWGGLKGAALGDWIWLGLFLAGLAASGSVGDPAAVEAAREKLGLLRGDSSPVAWLTLLFGFWVPLLGVWGTNQSICQRGAGAASLAKAQTGFVIAAWLVAILVPVTLLIVPDQSGRRIGALIPAAIAFSSLAALLHSASSLFALDLFKGLLAKNASDTATRFAARCFAVALGVGMAWAAGFSSPEPMGSINFPELWIGLQSLLLPGFVATFLIAFYIPRAPRVCGVAGLLGGTGCSGLLLVLAPAMAAPWRMLIAAGVTLFALLAITFVKPLPKAFHLPQNTPVDLKPSRPAYYAGLAAALLSVGLFLFFTFAGQGR